MVTEAKEDVISTSTLPDITHAISDVFEHFCEVTKGDTEYAEPFLDAWLRMQRQEGILRYYDRRYPGRRG